MRFRTRPHALILAASLAVVACGPGAASPSASVEPSEAPSPSASAEASPTASAALSGKQTI